MTLKIESSTTSESPDIIASFMNLHATGVLATSDAAGNPHGAVVYFKLHDDFTLTFATKTETQKYKNIEETKHAAFVVYDEKEQTAVQVTGRVETIEDHDERVEVINYMYITSPKLSMAVVPPAEKLLAGDYVALRLVPTVIKMAIYARPEAEENEDLYETLLFSE